MNLGELKPNQTSREYSNKLKSVCGIKVNIDELNLDHAQRMLLTVNEQIATKKKMSESRHTLHKNKFFTSQLLIRKILESKILELKNGNENVNVNKSKQQIAEGEESKAALLLATKDIIDRVQDVVDDISNTSNKDLPPLLDKIRDEMGSDISDLYNQVAGPALDELLTIAVETREIVSNASSILTGEYDPNNTLGTDVPVNGADNFSDEEFSKPADSFGASDGAIGGEEDAGRQERI